MNTKLKNNERQRLYRQTRRRFDYIPGEDVLEIIEKHRKLMTWNLSGVIDALIMVGDAALSGNTVKFADGGR